MLTFVNPIFMVYPDLGAFFVGVHFHWERFSDGRVTTHYHIRICFIPCLVFHIGWTTIRPETN